MIRTAHLLCLLFLCLSLWACDSGKEDDTQGAADGDTSDEDGDSTDPSDGDEQETPEDEIEFVEFSWQDLPDDVMNTRLCAEAADPENAPDTIYIDCTIEGENFVETPYEPKDELLVMAYNMERGYHVDEIIQQFQNGLDVSNPDVVLVSEVDRGCSRTEGRHILRDIAKALGMYYLYGVEFIELPREQGSGGQISSTCEHGNGILSRYPLGNVRLIRHETNEDWSGDEGEPRLGGRLAMVADVKVGESILGLAAIHFESNLDENVREAQALEMIEYTRSKAVPVVIGGDFNSGFYLLDLEFDTDSDKTIKPFNEAGFFDAHQSLPLDERTTKPDSGFLLDLLLSNEDLFSSPGIGSEDTFGPLSDHLPVWATVALP